MTNNESWNLRGCSEHGYLAAIRILALAPNRDYPSGVKPYDPILKARQIYWEHLNNGLFLGIDGWWMD